MLGLMQDHAKTQSGWWVIACAVLFFAAASAIPNVSIARSAVIVGVGVLFLLAYHFEPESVRFFGLFGFAFISHFPRSVHQLFSIFGYRSRLALGHFCSGASVVPTSSVRLNDVFKWTGYARRLT